MPTQTGAGLALLSSPVRRTIVDHLAAQHGSPGVTATELAEVLGLHVTTVRFHLDQLVAGGLLEASFLRQGVGRPRKVYSIAPGELRTDSTDRAMQLLTGLLAEQFGAAQSGTTLTPFEAGRKWAIDHVAPESPRTPAPTPGRWLAKLGHLIDVLRDWGYTSRVTTSAAGHTASVELSHCPFIDLARTNPAVACGIHRGLIAGTLEQFGEDDAEVSLEPFVGPHTCLAHITTRTSFAQADAASTRRRVRSVPDPERRTTSQNPAPQDAPSKETA
ncbi:MAG TPA: helix-turn-helix domain-containing protein [Intrasporangiaceae bacterium]|nr:helix-turn-helix domain-containing protein [Intrasporangiaceae bacterium]